MNARRHYAAYAAACLAAAAADAGGASTGVPAAPQLIPAPARHEPGRGVFRIEDGTRVHAGSGEAASIARYLIALVDRTRGIRLTAADAGDPAGAIALVLAGDESVSPESYRLTVARARILIEAPSPAGLFYGAVTLWQLATSDGATSGPASIPAQTITDTPRFPWRGLLLDSARHYQPPEFIERLIDWMALHKLNVLHWHLTDDQGWRLEIRKYPRLTEIGAWRVPAGAGPPRRYGGYYTQQQVRELVTYAAQRFVTVVPEIEMPGHAQAAIASYPELGTRGPPPPVSSDWGVHDQLFNAEESTLAFLEDVLAEVIELFPGKYVHIGGDEAVKDRWRGSPRVQARMRELGLADEQALQGWFVARIERFLAARGRRMIGWDEILESGIPPRASIMSWRGSEGAVAAARAGHEVVMTPAPRLYADYLQSDLPDEPPGRPTPVTLTDVYAYEPVPPELSTAEAGRILGAQLNAWTEHMRLPERVVHQVFPRAAAIAEVAWSPRTARDWTGFLDRIAVQFERYRRLGLAHADSAFLPRPELARGGAPGKLGITLANQAAFGEIRYTLDGHEPTAQSPEYRQPLDVDAGVRLRAAAFDGSLPLSAELDLALDERLLNTRRHDTLRHCTGTLVLRLEDDAPLEGERALFNVDIVDPCWVWPDADLSQGGALTVAVGQVPFNFQIGAQVDAIRRGDARTSEGELEVRIGSCDAAPAAVLPLATAAGNPEVTILPPLALPRRAAPADICLRFARPAVDPVWTVHWARLGD